MGPKRPIFKPYRARWGFGPTIFEILQGGAKFEVTLLRKTWPCHQKRIKNACGIHQGSHISMSEAPLRFERGQRKTSSSETKLYILKKGQNAIIVRIQVKSRTGPRSLIGPVINTLRMRYNTCTCMQIHIISPFLFNNESCNIYQWWSNYNSHKVTYRCHLPVAQEKCSTITTIILSKHSGRLFEPNNHKYNIGLYKTADIISCLDFRQMPIRPKSFIKGAVQDRNIKQPRTIRSGAYLKQ